MKKNMLKKIIWLAGMTTAFTALLLLFTTAIACLIGVLCTCADSKICCMMLFVTMVASIGVIPPVLDRIFDGMNSLNEKIDKLN